MTSTIFNLLNVLPLPIWLGMLLFPRARFTERLMLAYWPYMVLGGLYTLLLLIALATGSGSFDLSFAALKESFAEDWVFLAGWAHYLTLDLFAGVWLFRDAKYWGINPRVFVLLTLFFGPLGLASYLLTRQRKQKDDPVRVLN